MQTLSYCAMQRYGFIDKRSLEGSLAQSFYLKRWRSELALNADYVA